jgi:hypothetical protein
MIGQTINIGGTSYTVVTETGTDNITLNNPAPILDPASWSATIPDPPTPPPPDSWPKIEFVPMTLSCYCPGNGLGMCGLNTMALIYTMVKGTGSTSWNVSDTTGGSITVSTTGSGSIPMSLDFANASLTLTWAMDRSLLLSTPETSSMAASVLVDYICVDADGGTSHEQDVKQFQGADNCNCTTGTTLRSQLFVNGGTAGGTIYISSPLGACNGCTVITSSDLPVDVQILKHDGDSMWCLCATGGTYTHYADGSVVGPTYHFSIVSGHLSGTAALDPDNGCVTGTADVGDPGSSSLVFRVTDQDSGNTADTECGFQVPGCTAGPITSNWAF